MNNVLQNKRYSGCEQSSSPNLVDYIRKDTVGKVFVLNALCFIYYILMKCRYNKRHITDREDYFQFPPSNYTLMITLNGKRAVNLDTSHTIDDFNTYKYNIKLVYSGFLSYNREGAYNV